MQQCSRNRFMIYIPSLTCSTHLLSYDKLSKKSLLFKSFTGLKVKQFDDIYQDIEEKYEKHKIKRLSSKRKERRERNIGAGRPFKLDKKQVSDGFDLLPTVHHIHTDRLSL